MKKLSLILAAIVIIAVSACSDEQTSTKNGLTIRVKADTSVTYSKPITKLRVDCDGREVTDFPKIMGHTVGTIPVTTTKDTTITSSDLEKRGWYYGGSNGKKSGTSTADTASTDDGLFSWMPEWLQTLLKGLLVLAATLFVMWVLWWFFAWMYRNFPSWNRSTTPVETIMQSSNTQQVVAPAATADGIPAINPLQPVINITVGNNSFVGDIVISMHGDASGSFNFRDARTFSRTPGKAETKNPGSDTAPETQP